MAFVNFTVRIGMPPLDWVRVRAGITRPVTTSPNRTGVHASRALATCKGPRVEETALSREAAFPLFCAPMDQESAANAPVPAAVEQLREGAETTIEKPVVWPSAGMAKRRAAAMEHHSPPRRQAITVSFFKIHLRAPDRKAQANCSSRLRECMWREYMRGRNGRQWPDSRLEPPRVKRRTEFRSPTIQKPPAD